MQWHTITDQWLWFSAAAVFLVLFGALTALFGALAAYYFHKPKAYDATKPYYATEPYDAIQSQEGWIPTGRVDFSDPQSIGNFFLQVEETRIVDSIASVGHREIRWRRATLEEADSVLVGHHAQRNLEMAPNYIVTSSNVSRASSAVNNRWAVMRCRFFVLEIFEQI
jgi:hypothetical protein